MSDRHLTPDARRVRHRKVKALLAGTTVLGVGAAVTLASWTDQAFVDGLFGTTSFNIEVSTDGGATWEEADTTDTAADLGFSVGVDALEPGDTVYAPLQVRTDDAGSVAGTATVQGATLRTGDQGLFDALTYTLAQTATCDAAGVAAADQLVTDSPLGTGSAADVLALAADGAAPQDLCFAVTLPDSEADDAALQGQTATATWEITARSSD